LLKLQKTGFWTAISLQLCGRQGITSVFASPDFMLPGVFAGFHKKLG
jgi:hypothetical protein